MRKLQTKVTYESYKRMNIQESCIIMQSETDPEGSAKVTRKIVWKLQKIESENAPEAI